MLDRRRNYGCFYKHFTSKEALFEEIIQPHINALINMYNEEFTKYLLNLENIDIEKSWRENFNELDPFINYILRINVYSIWFYSNQLEPNIKILLKKLHHL